MALKLGLAKETSANLERAQHSVAALFCELCAMQGLDRVFAARAIAPRIPDTEV